MARDNWAFEELQNLSASTATAVSKSVYHSKETACNKTVAFLHKWKLFSFCGDNENY